MTSRNPSQGPRVRGALVIAAFATTLFALLPITPSWQIRVLYAPLCHQKAERTLTLLGDTMAVCSRCSGLYFGAAAALWLAVACARRLSWPHRLWFFAAAAPTAVDALLPWVGLPQLSLLPRHFVAWPAGFAAGWFFALGVAVIAAGLKPVKLETSVEVGDG